VVSAETYGDLEHGAAELAAAREEDETAKRRIDSERSVSRRRYDPRGAPSPPTAVARMPNPAAGRAGVGILGRRPGRAAWLQPCWFVSASGDF
jgi:hypothetical protein